MKQQETKAHKKP